MELSLQSIFSPGAMVGHASYGLLILSMLMTRIVWLRVFAIGSGLVGLTYNVFWIFDPVGMFWESTFVLTNVGQILLIAYRNKITRFTAEERAFYETAVPDLDPSQVRQLLRLGRWIDGTPGAELTREGVVVPDLVFLVSGHVDIEVGGHVVGRCGPGNFIGEISVSSGGPASATAVVREPVRYLAFDAVTLRQLLDKGSDIGRAVESAFRHGLREKLIRTNAAMAAMHGATVS